MEKKNTGTAVLVISIIAGALLIIGGIGMSGIVSVGGNSIAEAFYQKCGIAFIGLGVFNIAFGIGISNIINSLDIIISKETNKQIDVDEDKPIIM